MPYRQRGQFKLHHTVYESGQGSGPSVLLLHGLGSCGEDWLLQVPVLRQRYRVILRDLQGHGRSGLSRSWPTLSGLANDIADLLRLLGGVPVHVVGLSLGGVVGLQLAVDYPDLVSSLTVVNAFARLRLSFTGVGRGAGRLALLALGRMDWLGQLVAAGLFPAEEQTPIRDIAAARLASTSRRVYLQSLLALLRCDLRSRLGEVLTPTLVVAGKEDRTLPLRAKTELAERISGARLVVLDRSGHATPIDAAQRFNAMLIDFLQEIDRATGG